AHVAPTPPPDARVALAVRSGYVQTVHAERLVRLAAEHDLVVRLVPFVGGHVVAGHPVARVWARDGRLASLSPDVQRAVAEALTVGGERTLQQDVAFGLRQI